MGEAGEAPHLAREVVLGPRLPEVAIESVPFLRYRLIVVGAASHPLAGARDLAPAMLAGERSLAGPSAAAAAFLTRAGLDPSVLRAFPSDAAAVAEVAAVLDQLRRGSLVRLPVRGTPVEGLWHASALRGERRTAAAWALRRFVTSPEATHALLARPGGVPAGRYRPTVRVTLWNPDEVAAR